jgi:uncharacterized protein (TIGR02217 family)
MSNVVFPVLPGLMWDVAKSPGFTTRVQRAVSGFELRASLQAYPLWTFSLAYEVLRTDLVTLELQKLMGFFLARGGQFDSFLYTDPDDSSVTDMQFGVGDGTTVAFQLVRALGAGGFTFVEPVQNLNGAVGNIKDNGSTVSGANYSVSATGLVTFTTPPVAGHVLTWSGSYYFRVRFLQDMAGFSQFMQRLWELKKLEFIGAPGNKV